MSAEIFLEISHIPANDDATPRDVRYYFRANHYVPAFWLAMLNHQDIENAYRGQSSTYPPITLRKDSAVETLRSRINGISRIFDVNCNPFLELLDTVAEKEPGNLVHLFTDDLFSSQAGPYEQGYEYEDEKTWNQNERAHWKTTLYRAVGAFGQLSPDSGVTRKQAQRDAKKKDGEWRSVFYFTEWHFKRKKDLPELFGRIDANAPWLMILGFDSAEVDWLEKGA